MKPTMFSVPKTMHVKTLTACLTAEPTPMCCPVPREDAEVSELSNNFPKLSSIFKF